MSLREDEEFLRRLRETFEIEAAEHLQVIAAGLLQLERAGPSAPRDSVLDAVFRAAHSLKGAARAVDFAGVVSLCQSLEDAFAAWKRQQGMPPQDAFDSAHRTLDAIRATMTPVAGLQGTPPSAVPHDPPSVSRGPAAAAWPARKEPAAERKAFSPQDTVRISMDKLDTRLAEAEEMLAVKQAAARRARELRDLSGRLREWRKAWSAAEVEARGLRGTYDAVPAEGGRSAPRLKRLLDFLDWSAGCLKSMEHEAAGLSRSAEQDWHLVGKLVDDLLEDSKKLLLLPFSTISASFPKLVRDLCREQGKDAQLSVVGEDTELDKRVLEEIKDPLVHLLRNAVDHGIERPEERARRGKPARGAISLAVSQVEGSKVQLLLSDDGAGIDVGRVREAAARCGVITAEEAGALDEGRSRSLVFHAEVTTSPAVTQLSGRGLGLTIVREKVEKLGGEVSVEDRAGGGTVFRIVVPATRARFRGVVVEEQGRVLVVPTAQIERVARIGPDDVRTVEGREAIALDGAAVALVQLSEVLELAAGPRHQAAAAGSPVLVLGAGGDRVAFAVDAVLDEQEVLLKPLRKPLSRVRNVGAATVLASGQVAPILNVSDLLRSARKAGGPARRADAAPKPAAAARSILVAEDSITSRMLLKGMLESAGYRVKAAVDGMEAYTLLCTERFDLLVSDVEMPRLNGFELTARVRADRRLADLPVVLVTALETREDRERGIDAGASAYLVKSGFEQGRLLETVRRLIGGQAP